VPIGEELGIRGAGVSEIHGQVHTDYSTTEVRNVLGAGTPARETACRTDRMHVTWV
jgi:hypothetical protein